MFEIFQKTDVQTRLLNVVGRLSLLAQSHFTDFGKLLDLIEGALNQYELEFLAKVDRRKG